MKNQVKKYLGDIIFSKEISINEKVEKLNKFFEKFEWKKQWDIFHYYPSEIIMLDKKYNTYIK